ncbi:hypothetical protein [Streptomyces caniferus]|uniref:hypothetical protein n=1 Tax=Streptomyces caniferus TaxID=285557 RepID=UPI0037F2B410
MSPLYVGRHTGKPLEPLDPNRSNGSAPQLRLRRPAATNRRKVTRIAFWVGLFGCLAFSLAVIAGLFQGYYEMSHPPGGWCQDDSPKCEKR